MNTENPGEEEASTHQPGRLVKSALAEAVAQSIEIGSNEAAQIVEVIFDCDVRALQSGDRIELRGFGIFGIRERQGRTGRNPKTGAPVAVPAKRVAFFYSKQKTGKDPQPSVKLGPGRECQIE
jgi:integration host factor subunit beta